MSGVTVQEVDELRRRADESDQKPVAAVLVALSCAMKDSAVEEMVDHLRVWVAGKIFNEATRKR